MKRYRESEFDQFHPAKPCPECGRDDNYDVNWVDVTSAHDPPPDRYYVPGTVRCLNHYLIQPIE